MSDSVKTNRVKKHLANRQFAFNWCLGDKKPVVEEFVVGEVGGKDSEGRDVLCQLSDIDEYEMFNFMIHSYNVRITTHPVVLFIERTMVRFLKVLPILAQGVVVISDDPNDYGCSRDEYDDCLVRTIAFARSKGISSEKFFMVGGGSELWKLVSRYEQAGMPVVVIKEKTFDQSQNCMQMCYTKTGKGGSWKFRNVAESDLLEKFLDTKIIAKIGGIFLPKWYIDGIGRLRFPMWLYFGLKTIDGLAADYLLLKWASESFDNGLDPIVWSDVAGIASIGLLEFMGCYRDPFVSKISDKTYLKSPSGQLPRHEHLLHFLCNDDLAYGAELLVMKCESATDETCFVGCAYINFCVRFFDYIANAKQLVTKFAPRSAHVREIAIYVLYCMWSGESQTLAQVMGQLIRRNEKDACNLWLKSSNTKKINVIKVEATGWTGFYNFAFVPLKDEKGKNSFNNGKNKKK